MDTVAMQFDMQRRADESNKAIQDQLVRDAQFSNQMALVSMYLYASIPPIVCLMFNPDRPNRG